MKSTLLTRRTANRLLVGGAIAAFSAIIVDIATLFTIYQKAGFCSAASCQNVHFTWQLIVARICAVLVYTGVAAIIAGTVLLVVVRKK